jgi:hypothetical protein
MVGVFAENFEQAVELANTMYKAGMLFEED